MIRPLRRAHGVASLLLTLMVAAILAAALGWRVAAPVTAPDLIETQP